MNGISPSNAQSIEIQLTMQSEYNILYQGLGVQNIQFLINFTIQKLEYTSQYFLSGEVNLRGVFEEC